MNRLVGFYFCVLVVLSPLSFVANAADPIQFGETFTIESNVLHESRRINVYRAVSYSETENAARPVLYMLDGGIGEDFLHIAGLMQVSIANDAMRPFLLVGIENTQRRRDTTGPTSNAEDKKIAPVVGGSMAFRQFVRDELMPAISQRYAVTNERAIMGESLAGLFVIETLMTEPTLFNDYFAIDPALWWNNKQWVREVTAAAKKIPAGCQLFLAGSNAQGNGAVVAEFAAQLKLVSGSSLQWQHTVMSNESHGTIFHPAALQAFRTVLKPVAEKPE
jgi:predicted alpha/beta superfamily hydrolase